MSRATYRHRRSFPTRNNRANIESRCLQGRGFSPPHAFPVLTSRISRPRDRSTFPAQMHLHSSCRPSTLRSRPRLNVIDTVTCRWKSSIITLSRPHQLPRRVIGCFMSREFLLRRLTHVSLAQRPRSLCVVCAQSQVPYCTHTCSSITDSIHGINLDMDMHGAASSSGRTACRPRHTAHSMPLMQRHDIGDPIS